MISIFDSVLLKYPPFVKGVFGSSHIYLYTALEHAQLSIRSQVSMNPAEGATLNPVTFLFRHVLIAHRIRI